MSRTATRTRTPPSLSVTTLHFSSVAHVRGDKLGDGRREIRRAHAAGIVGALRDAVGDRQARVAVDGEAVGRHRVARLEREVVGRQQRASILRYSRFRRDRRRAREEAEAGVRPERRRPNAQVGPRRAGAGRCTWVSSLVGGVECEVVGLEAREEGRCRCHATPRREICGRAGRGAPEREREHVDRLAAAGAPRAHVRLLPRSPSSARCRSRVQVLAKAAARPQRLRRDIIAAGERGAGPTSSTTPTCFALGTEHHVAVDDRLLVSEDSARLVLTHAAGAAHTRRMT